MVFIIILRQILGFYSLKSGVDLWLSQKCCKSATGQTLESYKNVFNTMKKLIQTAAALLRVLPFCALFLGFTSRAIAADEVYRPRITPQTIRGGRVTSRFKNITANTAIHHISVSIPLTVNACSSHAMKWPTSGLCLTTAPRWCVTKRMHKVSNR